LDVLLEALTHLTTSFPGFVGRADAEKRPDPVPELMALILDGERRGSINFDLRALLNSAYAVRDRLSTDTWRVINGIRGRLDELETKSANHLSAIQDDLDELVITLVALSGLTQESMMRGQSWLFLELGRRIERALLLITLVRVTLGKAREPEVEMQLLSAMLRSTESLMSYRRGYGDAVLIEPVIGLLLTDAANPRSLAYQLLQLEQRAAELPRDDERSSLGEVQRLMLDANSALRLVRFEQLTRIDEKTRERPELESLLRHVTQRLLEASNVMTRDYFTDVRGPQQLAPSYAESAR
ncbi:MAG TPA: alpha-E domain-containing protein, partial [Gammaproteobacteria bacterium]|nr:alpha-E domain-containing protein [Gammaproteobacteria bacterium]